MLSLLLRSSIFSPTQPLILEFHSSRTFPFPSDTLNPGPSDPAVQTHPTIKVSFTSHILLELLLIFEAHTDLPLLPVFTTASVNLGASQVAPVVKNLLASAGGIRVMGSIPGVRWSPGGGHGNSLQYSCLENPMNRGAWRGYRPWGCPESDTTEQLLSVNLCYFLLFSNDARNFVCFIITSTFSFTTPPNSTVNIILFMKLHSISIWEFLTLRLSVSVLIRGDVPPCQEEPWWKGNTIFLETTCARLLAY